MYTDTLLQSAKTVLSWHNLSEQVKAERLAVVVEAMSWISTPYHHMGRVKGAGVDCGMFIAEVFERCGLIPHIDTGYYPADWGMHRSEEYYLRHVNQLYQKVDRDTLPGDIILHRFGRCVSHGVIVVVGNTVIHSYINQGVLIADRYQDELCRRERGCFSLIKWERT